MARFNDFSQSQWFRIGRCTWLGSMHMVHQLIQIDGIVYVTEKLIFSGITVDKKIEIKADAISEIVFLHTSMACKRLDEEPIRRWKWQCRSTVEPTSVGRWRWRLCNSRKKILVLISIPQNSISPSKLTISKTVRQPLYYSNHHHSHPAACHKCHRTNHRWCTSTRATMSSWRPTIRNTHKHNIRWCTHRPYPNDHLPIRQYSKYDSAYYRWRAKCSSWPHQFDVSKPLPQEFDCESFHWCLVEYSPISVDSAISLECRLRWSNHRHFQSTTTHLATDWTKTKTNILLRRGNFE